MLDWWRRRHDPERSSGLRTPREPPDGDALEVMLFYLDHWESDFARARLVVKKRASLVAVLTATGTGAVAVVGAVTTATGWSSLGILSAAIASAVTVLGAWDGVFRHRELWQQRSVILRELQEIKRSTKMRLALGAPRNDVARVGDERLSRVLAQDVASWSEIRDRQPPDPPHGTAGPDQGAEAGDG